MNIIFSWRSRGWSRWRVGTFWCYCVRQPQRTICVLNETMEQWRIITYLSTAAARSAYALAYIKPNYPVWFYSAHVAGVYLLHIKLTITRRQSTAAGCAKWDTVTAHIYAVNTKTYFKNDSGYILPLKQQNITRSSMSWQVIPASKYYYSDARYLHRAICSNIFKLIIWRRWVLSWCWLLDDTLYYFEVFS